MKCDVLFINPDGLGRIYGNLATDVMTIEPPVWAMMLSKSVEAKGYKTRIYDCIIERASENDIRTVISQSQPKLIVMAVYGQHPSASTHTMYGARITSNAIQVAFPKAKILYLGGHVSALPEQTVLEEPCHFAAKGEGLYTILDLLKIDLNSPTDLRQVRGLYFQKEGKIEQGPAASIVANANMDSEYPGLDYKDVDLKRYRAPNWFLYGNLSGRSSYASIYTSLGCPYQCSFCCINAPFSKNVYRTWSTEHILNEFHNIYLQGATNVKIADELFILKESHYLPICRELIRRKYDFNMWAFARVDSIKKEHLPTLKKAGINWLILGIESYSELIRKGVKKGQYQRQDIERVVKEIQAAGIFVHANFLFGMPDDTFESMQESLNFAIDLDVETANFYCMMPYPGSELYQEAKAKGLPMPSDWVAYSQHGEDTLPLPTKFISGEEVLTFRDQAWMLFHTNKRYLSSIEKKFGVTTRSYIESLTKIELKRNHIVDRVLATEPPRI